MSAEEASEGFDLAELAVDIIFDLCLQQLLRSSDLPQMISEVHVALAGLQSEPNVEVVERQQPAVPIKKSSTQDYLISLEDGRRSMTLKQYLARLGRTPSEYQSKWALPRGYPMVASSYTAKRSELAKSQGLGRKAAASRLLPRRRLRRRSVAASPKLPPKSDKRAFTNSQIAISGLPPLPDMDAGK